jgi:two-component system response regulator
MIESSASRTKHLLVVEDDPGDVLLTREALAGTTTPLDVHVVQDGEAAVDFLRREGGHRDAPRPDLVLLDLNLPRLDGREVLARIKSDPGLWTIPVVVLTTSKAAEDVRRSYELHANAFVTKPAELDRFLSVVRQVGEFFLTVVRLPTRN